MLSASASLELVSNFTCLTSKKNHEEAMRILKKVATMVRPIMKAHGWKITTLAEFYTKGLLGMNTNRGWKIQLCLRYHSDENTFLPWEEVLGTMLHELAHNIRGPHDQLFYKALDDLNDEYDKVVASGYTGEGFDAVGHRLGTKNGGFGLGGTGLGGALGSGLVTSGTRAAAVMAAEKRRQANEMMLPAGGRRLGGSGGSGGAGLTITPKGFWEQWHSPGELAAMAAERRAKDQLWCGSSSPTSSSTSSLSANSSPDQSPSRTPPTTTTKSNPNNGSSTPTSASRPSVHNNTQQTPIVIDCDASTTTTTTTKRRGSTPTATTIVSTPKKPRSDQVNANTATAQNPSRSAAPTTTSTTNQWTEWSCPLCTLVNRPLALQCECCFTQRPAE